MTEVSAFVAAHRGQVLLSVFVLAWAILVLWAPFLGRTIANADRHSDREQAERQPFAQGPRGEIHIRHTRSM